MALTSGMEQAGKLIARAAVQSGILALSPSQIDAYDPFAATDPNVLQLIEFLNSLGSELSNTFQWSRQKKEYTFATVAGTTLYDLPTDFYSFVHESGWNRSVRLPLLGPLTSQEVQTIKAQLTGVVLNVPWRQVGNQFEFPMSPPNGQTIAFEYLSSNWISTDGLTVDASAATVRTHWVLHSPLLIVRGLKLRWAEAKGFDTTVLERQYALALQSAAVRATSARSLRADGGKIIDRYLDRPNVPPSGFGS